MTERRRPRVSYCITCKGRRYHLEQTLALNLAAEQGYDDVEFVLVDYDSDDGLADWVRANFAEALATGRLVYAYYGPAPFFRMAHAKNLAHRLAKGVILCNLDADNILAPDFSRWLIAQFSRQPNQVLSPRSLTVAGYLRDRWINIILSRPSLRDGQCGRIAMTRSTFLRLRGYNEAFSAWGGDDLELLLRARAEGLIVASIPAEQWGEALRHENSIRIANLSPEDRQWSAQRLGRNRLNETREMIAQIVSHDSHRVNSAADFGCGTVLTGYPELSPRTLDPLPPGMSKAEQNAPGRLVTNGETVSLS